MLKAYSLECECGAVADELLEQEEVFLCPTCGKPMTRLISAPRQFSTIIPCYPGAKRRKAGYQHLYTNQPATRIQVGYGGGISRGEK